VCCIWPGISAITLQALQAVQIATELRDALGACTELNSVYRQLVKMALADLQLIEQQIGRLDQEIAPTGGETTLHLFALSRTLRIRQLDGLSFSTVESISPLRAIVDYCSALTDFHTLSRAIGPS